MRGNHQHCLRLMLVAALALGLTSVARAQDESQVKAGLEVWKKAGCPECHGPFSDGNKQNDDMPTGANLRGSRLDAAAIKQTVRCGRPDTGMPSFDGGAYTARPCYGQPLGEAPDNLYPAPRTLTLAEIDSVIVYLQARVLGHPQITREDCLFYYWDQPSWCDK